jgi:hypothetical protein
MTAVPPDSHKWSQDRGGHIPAFISADEGRSRTTRRGGRAGSTLSANSPPERMTVS